MLIISKKYIPTSDVVKKRSYKMVNEASRKNATELISNFITDLVRVKNEFENDLKKESAIIDKLIGNLIRSWSDTCAVAYSESVCNIVDAGYKYAFDTKSNSANFKKWLGSLDLSSEENARAAIFAVAHACVSNDSRYMSPKAFADICKGNNIKVIYPGNKRPAANITIEFKGGYSAEHMNFIKGRIEKAQSPFYYEHYIPVDQVRSTIYKIIDEQPDDMQEQIYEALTCMLVCWITGYENSRIPQKYKTERKNPFNVYSKSAGIKLYDKRTGGNSINSKEEMSTYISNQLELDNNTNNN